jgi:hypothetical protein
MEEVFKEEQITIGRLDRRTRELQEETKEAHAIADAHISACAKLLEDLDQCVGVVSQWELKVVKREKELQRKEEEITNKIEHERSKLTSHTDDPKARETALEMEQERLTWTCQGPRWRRTACEEGWSRSTPSPSLPS